MTAKTTKTATATATAIKAPRVFQADLFRQAGAMGAQGESLVARIGAMLAGSCSPVEYKAARAAFIEGYMSEPGRTKKASTTAWERFCKAFKVLRPASTTTAATKKRAARAAAKTTAATTTAKPATNPQSEETSGDTDPVSPASGAKAGKQITMMLSTIEAHLLAMLRAGKFAQVHELVRSMEGTV